MPPDQLGLISVKIVTKKQISENSKKESLKELGTYFESSILPHDIVIPGNLINDENVAYYMIVSADRQGVEAVINRLDRQWKYKNKISAGEIQLSFEYQMVEIPDGAQYRNLSVQEQMKLISSSVEHMINRST